ncbi:MAG: hypothetical protein KJ559_02710 [Nanoarchaeota archaeon]|nr:hypothetical protein [Nanoarchaeota archaeon]
MEKRKKGAIELEMLAWFLIAFAVLVIIVVGYIILSGKGIGIIEHIKNLFRFGR